MWWIVILLLISGIFIYILFAPIIVEIDTQAGLIRLQFHWIANASILFAEGAIKYKLVIVGHSFKYDSNSIKRSTNSDQTKKKTRGFGKIPFRKLVSVMKSFKVSKMFVSIDTGNIELNGILFPVFHMLGKRNNRNISINFLNENIILMQAKNNFARVIWAFIKK